MCVLDVFGSLIDDDILSFFIWGTGRIASRCSMDIGGFSSMSEASKIVPRLHTCLAHNFASITSIPSK